MLLLRNALRVAGGECCWGVPAETKRAGANATARSCRRECLERQVRMPSVAGSCRAANSVRLGRRGYRWTLLPQRVADEAGAKAASESLLPYCQEMSSEAGGAPTGRMLLPLRSIRRDRCKCRQTIAPAVLQQVSREADSNATAQSLLLQGDIQRSRCVCRQLVAPAAQDVWQGNRERSSGGLETSLSTGLEISLSSGLS
jgi:hypothetical protein